MNRGEVWWVEDPDTGRRPYLVLTRQPAIAVLNRLLAVPATTTLRGIPTEVVVEEDDGMPQRSAFSFDNLTAVRKALFTERICQLGVDRLDEVCRALNTATGC